MSGKLYSFSDNNIIVVVMEYLYGKWNLVVSKLRAKTKIVGTGRGKVEL